jgi:hypothetical protein
MSLVSVGPTNYTGGWQHIPLPSLLEALGERGAVHRSDEAAGKPFVEVMLEATIPVEESSP